MAYDPRLDPNNSEYDPDFATAQEPALDRPVVRGPADAPPDAVWQDYAATAIRTLYPHLTDGVDYMWGRSDPDSPPEMVYWNDAKYPAADLGKIEEVATALMNADPYRAGGYTPKPPLHGGSVLGAGEVPKGERAQDQPGVAPDLSTGPVYNPPSIQ